jgi:hypothetical protein
VEKQLLTREKMRAFALSGLAALAISMLAPATVWAFSTEQASPSGGAAANLADQEDPLRALQDKVDGKHSSQQSGFYFSNGSAQQPFTPYGSRSNQTGTNVPFDYSPMPGFRGQRGD